jgi:predicted acetyltransferase
MTSLDLATPSDRLLVSNLLQLYIHDLSAIFRDVELGADGRFSYPALPLYWSEPERRFPFLIRRDGGAAGFVFVTRGSPAVADPDVFDVAEFFIVRRHRRSGIGREAAFLLWSRLPGKWTVRVSMGNPRALAFWSPVVREFSHGTAIQFTRPGKPNEWRVFSFESPRA